MAGDPSHFEIGVPDARRAKAFYGELLGWSFRTTTGENAWIETGGVREVSMTATMRPRSSSTSVSPTSRQRSGEPVRVT